MNEALEIREVMVRTGNDRCILVIAININNHWVEAVVNGGAKVSVLSSFMVV